jgi:hypothetical protein
MTRHCFWPKTARVLTTHRLRQSSPSTSRKPAFETRERAYPQKRHDDRVVAGIIRGLVQKRLVLVEDGGLLLLAAGSLDGCRRVGLQDPVLVQEGEKFTDRSQFAGPGHPSEVSAGEGLDPTVVSPAAKSENAPGMATIGEPKMGHLPDCSKLHAKGLSPAKPET